MGKHYLQEFANPSAKFRGAPFWSWNCKLDREMMLRQIDYFREMGMGGFTMHSRTGLDTEYLGKEFMEVVRACVDKAKALGMEACLYDEDRWPSGYAGGFVTKDEQYRMRYLVFCPYAPGEDYPDVNPAVIATTPPPKGSRKLLARYDVRLEDGYLADYRMLQEGETGENLWYAYLEVTGDNAWFNNQSYVDPLNKKAIERFIEETHEKYKAVVGEEFGKTVPSIFTDEPEMSLKTNLGRPEDRGQYPIPYTDDFEQGFQQTYGDSFLRHLPELFWELPDGQYSVHRYRYMDYLSERFASAYSNTLGQWCEKNGIALTGHMQAEETLGQQTQLLGEAMRHYRAFQIPGIDMLCDWWAFSTAKQAQSVKHQMGREEMTSELYGVTNWDFDFRGHKLQGDWQAALGVTHRVHHLALASLGGEAKRDYPASIFYQSPWYAQYKTVEEYFARVNTALRTGEPVERIAVVHPIESYWLLHGPNEQTGQRRDKLEREFDQIVHWLLLGALDFDFLCESIARDLPTAVEGSHLRIGQMQYDAVVVPDCLTLRGTTMTLLEEFQAAGGKVIFAGGIPSLVDAVPSERPRRLAEKAVCVRFDQLELLDALEPLREVEIRGAWGARSERYIYQLRRDGDNRILFIAQGHRTPNRDIPRAEDVSVAVQGLYSVELLDAMTGARTAYPATYENGRTVVRRRLYDQDSLLLYLTALPAAPEATAAAPEEAWDFVRTLNEVESFRLEEPNVLLLDQAEYALDGEPLRAAEEVLRADDEMRRRLGYPLRLTALAQPWTKSGAEARCEHTVTLRYTFESEITVEDAALAIEPEPGMQVWLNGAAVDPAPAGYFIDTSIARIPLPPLHPGVNELVVELPFGRKTNIEWCYILGDFGVQVRGNRAVIVGKNRWIGFSDITAQGMPFYGGNLTYTCALDVEQAGDYALEITKFRAPLLQVRVDGGEARAIAFSPYRAELGHLAPGRHVVEITSFGNRFNTFGILHHCDDGIGWIGPGEWRSTGVGYSYEYHVRDTGILVAPRLMKRRESGR